MHLQPPAFTLEVEENKPDVNAFAHNAVLYPSEDGKHLSALPPGAVATNGGVSRQHLAPPPANAANDSPCKQVTSSQVSSSLQSSTPDPVPFSNPFFHRTSRNLRSPMRN